jgi:hypothetical protein
LSSVLHLIKLRSILPFVVLTGLASCDSGSSGSSPASSESASGPATSATSGAPPPTSETRKSIPITGVRFNYGSHVRLAKGSDNWAPTWSDDDQQYASWGDGGGFGGNEGAGRASLGFARIEGEAHDYRGVNRYGGVNAECRASIDAKAHGALLSIGGVLYAWLTPQSGPMEYDVFTLYSSGDKGCTWSRRNVRFTRAAHGISFGSFVQFGKDNGAAIDEYVYTVAPEVHTTHTLSIVQRPGKIMLLRVPRDSIESSAAYEFYAGADADGRPAWSANPDEKVPIYEDLDGVGPFPQMSYVPGLHRFVYTNQHGNGRNDAGMRSLLTMAEAPHPWGPWHIVYHDVFHPQNERTLFQWNFAPKWFRNDGREFTLIFTGIGSNDSWNTVNGTFEVAG